jgi:hypothetical protein
MQTQTPERASTKPTRPKGDAIRVTVLRKHEGPMPPALRAVLIDMARAALAKGELHA